MSRKLLLAASLCTLVSAASAQVPAAELAKPPASATHYIIQSTGGKHGDSWRWTTADGTRMGRESINLRGQVFELDSSGKAGADGMPASTHDSRRHAAGRRRRNLHASPAARRAGRARWMRAARHTRSRRSIPRRADPSTLSAWLFERLLASPDHTLPLLPGGKAQGRETNYPHRGRGRGEERR